MLNLLKSFKNAFVGIYEAFLQEVNFRLMLLLIFAAFVLLIFYGIEGWGLLVFIFASFFMLIVELINTAIEDAMDIWNPSHMEEIRVVKDVMAGAALLASFLWVITLIFILFFI